MFRFFCPVLLPYFSKSRYLELENQGMKMNVLATEWDAHTNEWRYPILSLLSFAADHSCRVSLLFLFFFFFVLPFPTHVSKRQTRFPGILCLRVTRNFCSSLLIVLLCFSVTGVPDCARNIALQFGTTVACLLLFFFFLQCFSLFSLIPFTCRYTQRAEDGGRRRGREERECGGRK